MRAYRYLRILVPCVVWFLIIMKLHTLIQQKSETVATVNKNMMVMIDYFQNMYVNTIEEAIGNPNGFDGKGVVIPENEKEQHDKAFDLYKFNELASSKIPILRKYPEKRRKSCFHRRYSTDLPTASIIIIYRNEAWTTLLRTVHTCLSRAPDYLVSDYILVDDYSDFDAFPHLGSKLNDHFSNNKKVKIIRAPKRVGLTYARLLGANAATGDVLVFLDSHCECAVGWLEPILMDIKENPNVTVTPIIDVISLEDFSIHKGIQDMVSVGSFTWKADFTWHTPKEQDPSYKMVL